MRVISFCFSMENWYNILRGTNRDVQETIKEATKKYVEVNIIFYFRRIKIN